MADSALKFSAKLPRTDFDEIRDEIDKALHSVTAHISKDSVIEKIASDRTNWNGVEVLLERIEDVTKVDARLLTQDIGIALNRCASQYPADSLWSGLVRRALDRLHERLERNSDP